MNIKKSISYFNKLNMDYNIIKIDNNILNVLSKKCKHIFNINKQLFYLRNKNDYEICTICNDITNKNVSYSEKELANFIKDNYNGKILENTKDVISPYELDIYLSDLKLAIEFNGLYYHSNLYKNKN